MPDWEERALASEIEYSRALKSLPVNYQDFIHLYNPYVPWSGDFNRVIGVKLSDIQSFKRIVSQVEDLHQEKSLDRPDRYDIASPALNPEKWQAPLEQAGYRLETAIFFSASTLAGDQSSDFVLESPGQTEYLEWFCRLTQERGYYEEDWFKQVRPLQLNFTSIFKPYWLKEQGKLIGWVYCANLGEYARLFEVEIKPDFRGQGMGKRLLEAIRVEMGKDGVSSILLQAGEELRHFYESAGFEECCRNSIIWLRH